MSASFEVELVEIPTGVWNVIVEASVGTWHKDKRVEFCKSEVVFSSEDEKEAQKVYDSFRDKLR